MLTVAKTQALPMPRFGCKHHLMHHCKTQASFDASWLSMDMSLLAMAVIWCVTVGHCQDLMCHCWPLTGFDVSLLAMDVSPLAIDWMCYLLAMDMI